MTSTRFDRCEIRRSLNHLGCEVGDEKVILHTKTGQYLGMNPVGAFLWELLTAPRRGSELVKEVTDRYDVDLATAQVDVTAFLADLSAAGLIEVREL